MIKEQNKQTLSLEMVDEGEHRDSCKFSTYIYIKIKYIDYVAYYMLVYIKRTHF